MSTDPVEDRRPPLTPALALRVAIVGSVILALFAIVFFRLWFLQVLTGSQYVRAASVNQVRDVAINPPRGEILDRNGTVLVNSTKALAVTVTPTELPVPVNAAPSGDLLYPPRRDAAVYNRLAHVLGISTRRTHCKVPVPPPSCTATNCPSSTTVRLSSIGCTIAQKVALLPYADVQIKSPVAPAIEYYVAERQPRFRGVNVQQVYVTGFPQNTLAAQVLGTVGPINGAELKARTYRGATANSIVGQSGLEAQYDDFLRGRFGEQKVQINATGEPTGHVTVKPPVPGHNLQLSLDAKLQRVGQQSLAQSIAAHGGAGGAFVAMSPTDGSVYAMGSAPTYNANDMVPPVSTRVYKALTSPSANQPLFNRAIQATNPTGSTFKPITATAALQSGNWNLADSFDDTGQFCVGTGGAQQCRHNSGHAAYGVVNLIDAIKVSDDDFFYNLGARTNVDPTKAPNGGPLDHWASLFGVGRNPQIDLPGAVSGTLPSPRWRASRNRLEYECDTATGVYRYTDPTGKHFSAHLHKGWRRGAKHTPGGCGIADGANRPWSIGDNESLAVGQGDVQVSPLQLAIAYSAVENGGTIVRPHIGESVQSADGTVLQKINPAPSRHIPVSSVYLDAIREGLREAASSSGGTSADVMGSFHQQVYGKTGTAQYIPTSGANAGVETDYAWYACFVPATATSKPIVVVVWVEKGGFGDVAAAPVARQILSQWFYDKPGPFVSGTSTTL